MKSCNCQISCNITIYGAQILSRKEADFYVKPGSNINLYFLSNLITTMEEVIGYDWNSFLSDIGGSLGFLLGLSVIGTITIAENFLQMVFKITKDNKEENTKNNYVQDKENPPLNKEQQISEEEKDVKNIIDYLNNCDYYEKNSIVKKHEEVNKY